LPFGHVTSAAEIAVAPSVEAGRKSVHIPHGDRDLKVLQASSRNRLAK